MIFLNIQEFHKNSSIPPAYELIEKVPIYFTRN